MGGASMFDTQRGQNLLRGVAAGDGQGNCQKTALAEFDVGADWLRQSIGRQAILSLRGSGYGYYRRSFFLSFLLLPCHDA